MTSRRFDDFSEFVAALIREAYERFIPGEPIPELPPDPTEDEIAAHIAEIHRRAAQMNEPKSEPMAAAHQQTIAAAETSYGKRRRHARKK